MLKHENLHHKRKYAILILKYKKIKEKLGNYTKEY